jgi:hypothetical protein
MKKITKNLSYYYDKLTESDPHNYCDVINESYTDLSGKDYVRLCKLAAYLLGKELVSLQKAVDNYENNHKK